MTAEHPLFSVKTAPDPQGSGAVFTLNNGCSAVITCDGAGNGAGVTGANGNPQFGNVTAQGTLSVQGAADIYGTTTLHGATTFSQPQTMGTLNVNQLIITGGPSLANGDIYFRNSVGALQSIAIGAVGQVLRVVSGPAIGWATVGMSIGDVITGSQVRCVY